MKRLALHVTSISLLLAGSAAAADLRRPMPVKAPAPVPPLAYNWTGCYVGAGGGYGMFNQEARFLVGGAPLGRSNDIGGLGWFGTVQIGCDYQINSSGIVIGAFADYDFGNIRGDWAHGVYGGLVGEEKLRSSWAAGGRIGWLPFPQLLVFVSGGYTEARFDQINLRDAITGALDTTAVAKHTYSGWFVGAGYEYGLAWFPGLFWKTEYRFADYGTERVALLEAVPAQTPLSFDMHKYVHTVRSELVWRFNPGGIASPVKASAPAPVVYNWTGCYVGAGGGYGMWNQESTYVAPPPLGLSNDIGGRGWFGTVQIGCDYQVGSNIIIGASADYDFSGIKGDLYNAAFHLATNVRALGEEKLKSSWAAGGRIGWLPFQQLLVFASGGYTEARFDQINLAHATTGAPFDIAVAKHTYSGWFLGTGYEYGIGWLPGLFWKTEYRFADYGTERVALFTPSTGAPRGDFFDMDKRIHTVRSELVWRFNFGSAVVARY